MGSFGERFRALTLMKFGRQIICVGIQFCIRRELVIVSVVLLVALDPLAFQWLSELSVEFPYCGEKVDVVWLFGRPIIFDGNELDSVDGNFTVH